MINKIRKCIKGFDSELRCRGFQYEVGKSYKLPKGEHVKLCYKGFHAIDEDENPLEVFGYYPPFSKLGTPNRYCEVEISGETKKDGEKIVGSEIRIIREIGFQGVFDSYKEWMKIHGEQTEENTGYTVKFGTDNLSFIYNTGDYSVASNTGWHSVSLNTGFCSSVANTNDDSVAYNNGQLPLN